MIEQVERYNLPWTMEDIMKNSDGTPQGPVQIVDSGNHTVTMIGRDNIELARFMVDCVNKVEAADKLLKKLGCWYAEKERLENMVERLCARIEDLNNSCAGRMTWMECNGNRKAVAEARKLLEDYKDETS